LKDKVFKEYLEHTLQEIKEINPKHIIAFGNQVSSVLLGRPIKVSDYKNDEHETLTIESTERRNENLKISENFHDVELIPTTLDA
jgi:uracil-DNA glycosylase